MFGSRSCTAASIAVDDSAPSVVTDVDADELAGDGDANATGAESANNGPASDEDENVLPLLRTRSTISFVC